MKIYPLDIRSMINPSERLPQDVKYIVYEDDDFMCVYDILHENKETFHYTAWCKRDIRSLLDIEQKYIPKIKNLISNMSKEFNLTYDNSDIFIHFPPSYWRLHIHFTYKGFFKIKHEMHKLHDIIKNISNDNNYYRKRVYIKQANL